MMTTENPLRPIRKSAFITYKQCQKKFEFMYYGEHYFDYGEEDQDNHALRRGNLFHNGCEKFFKNIQNKIHTAELPNHFREYLPIIKDDRDLIVNEWFDWFAEQEKIRYDELTLAEKCGEWMPIATELQIKMEDTIDRTGHVDRLDIIPGTKNICVVEYKTGKSYDMDKPYVFTAMNAEIGFYVQVLRAAKVFPNNPITHWKVINPTLKKIWFNKISPISLKGVETTYGEITEKVINKGKFKKNPSVLCLTCPYLDDCLFDEEGLDIGSLEL